MHLNEHPDKDFNNELNGWKNSIEREIRKSDEYDDVIAEVENVLTKIKDQKDTAAEYEVKLVSNCIELFINRVVQFQKMNLKKWT